MVLGTASGVADVSGGDFFFLKGNRIAKEAGEELKQALSFNRIRRNLATHHVS
jgi:hypothetical protein